MTTLFFQDKGVRVFWRCIPQADLHWQRWGEEFVVFNSASGQTHLLDPIAALLVREVVNVGGRSVDIVDHIAGLLEVQPTDEFRETIHKTLLQLDALGLIEAATA